MTKVVVTGAGGYLGRALCLGLVQDGHDVTALARRSEDISFFRQRGLTVCEAPSLNDMPTVTEAFRGNEVLIHLADSAERKLGREDDTETSAALAYSVANAATNARVKRIIFSSSIYARLHSEGNRNFYGAGKIAAENIFTTNRSFMTITLRLPPIYGPDSRGSFDKLQKLVARGIPIPFGYATAKRDYLFRDNFVYLIICLVNGSDCSWSNANGQFFEPCDGQGISTADLAALIAKSQQRPAHIISFPLVLLKMASKIMGLSAEFDTATSGLVANGNETLEQYFGWIPKSNLQENLNFLDRNNFRQ